MTIEDTGARSAQGGIRSLIAREAGYSVAAECLRVQAEAELLDPSLRSSDGVRLHEGAWSWYQGALGEIHVGQVLASLGSEWRVLHSVPIGQEDTDVDHILIGPNGVFVLNTKHHAGASVWVGDVVMMINNAKTPHLHRARSENVKVGQRLRAKVGFPVEVRSAIVVVGERKITDIRDADRRPIAVVSSRHLVRWLTAQPATLSRTELDLVRLAAEEPDTWHVDPHRADNLRVMQRFARLQDAVGTAVPRPQTSHAAVAQPVDMARATPPPARRTKAPRVRSDRPARTPSRMTRAQSKRSERRTKQLAEAIVAFGFLAVVVTMIDNGTWIPFVTSIFTMLSSTP